MTTGFGASARRRTNPDRGEEMFDTQSTLKCCYRENIDSIEMDPLAVVAFGDYQAELLIENGVPYVLIPSKSTGFDSFFETWATDKAIECGRGGPLIFAHDGTHLFCAGRIPERRNYSGQTFDTYCEAFRLADRLGYPELFRMWNYISEINTPNSEGLEIYRDFCRGRARAFELFEKRIPAATGVGASSGGILFYFLACRDKIPVHLENPRQVPAYHYPPRYGPKSPKFARATMTNLVGAYSIPGTLYIAGTASVLGHESVRAGSVRDQSDVALENIGHLINESNLRRYGYDYGFELHDLRVAKVYVRKPEHLEIIREKCLAAFSPDIDIRFLNLDICRRDLLVEIEGII
jgi:chorismate lyase / 3-hydroxybenzoate synthase